jgi:hypothetical protein
MESEINKQIRDVLDKYCVHFQDTVLRDELNLTGALAKVFWDNRKEHYARVLSMVNSHGFMQFLMGEYEYKEIKKPTIAEKCSHEWTEVEGNGDVNEQCMSCKALREWKFQK